MVQPLPPVISANRPKMALLGPAIRSTNSGKYGEFRHHLHQGKALLADPLQREQMGRMGGPQSPREDREIPVEEERGRTLAPEEQWGVGRVNLDPAEWLAAITSAGGMVEGRGSEAGPIAHAPELSELVEGWVRRVALGGDQRRAVARLDIGHGKYAGAELVITAQGDRVSVELTLPEGAAVAGLSERLSSRLTARGYAAEVEVR